MVIDRFKGDDVIECWVNNRYSTQFEDSGQAPPGPGSVSVAFNASLNRAATTILALALLRPALDTN